MPIPRPTGPLSELKAELEPVWDYLDANVDSGVSTATVNAIVVDPVSMTPVVDPVSMNLVTE